MPPSKQQTPIPPIPKPGQLWEPSVYHKKYLIENKIAIKLVLVLEVNNTLASTIFLTAECKKYEMFLTDFIYSYTPCKPSTIK